MSEGEFSVCQFFADNAGHEYAARYVDAKSALTTAFALTCSVGAQVGTTDRVIVTDGGDCIAWEWKFGAGITFPPTTQEAP